MRPNVPTSIQPPMFLNLSCTTAIFLKIKFLCDLPIIYLNPLIFITISMCWNWWLGYHHFICIYYPKTLGDELIQLVSAIRNLKPYLSVLLIVQDLRVANLLLPNSKPLVDIWKLRWWEFLIRKLTYKICRSFVKGIVGLTL